MERIKILAIGTNQPIMRTLERLINKVETWEAKISFSIEDACECCMQHKFGLILIGAGIDHAQEQQLKQFLAEINCLTPIVKHYGGGSGLLNAEIYAGLANNVG